MRIDREEFEKSLHPDGIYKRIGRSMIPFSDHEKPGNRAEFIDNLYADISQGKYFPSVPRGYIVLNKHNGVARIVPSFSYRDICVYFYCVTQIEEHLALGRVAGTFGGWSLGNAFRLKEKDEIVQRRSNDDEDDSIGPYGAGRTLTKSAWKENWEKFQSHAEHLAKDERFTYFVNMDIANVYDTISLDHLERKVRAFVPSEKSEVIDLLFVFLRNCNRQVQGYAPRTVGLPADETGDCSRILANFYLREYDELMRGLCGGSVPTMEYLRYADDQIILMESSGESARTMFEASRKLHSLGLNINSGKILQFRSRADYDYFWCFDLFKLLDDDQSDANVNKAAAEFLARLNSRTDGRPWRIDSVRKRLISVGIERLTEPSKSALVSHLLEGSQITRLEYWMLEKLAKALNQPQRDVLFNWLESWSPSVPFNSFHLHLLRFYRQSVRGRSREGIERDLARASIF